MPRPLKKQPVIFWFRSDLRLSDNPALIAAHKTGQTVIPVFILDDKTPGIWKRGAASRWWLHHSLSALQKSLHKAKHHPLVLLKGAAASVMEKLLQETQATAVFWNRLYTPWAMTRDQKIKENIRASGLQAESFQASLLFEPWQVVNKSGQPYKVFTPFYRTCLAQDGIRAPVDSLGKSKQDVPEIYRGLALEDLKLMPGIKWYQGMQSFWVPGEAGARQRLQAFIEEGADQYKTQRDFPAIDGVSRLSPHLHFGEISPHQIWSTVQEQLIKRQDACFTDHAHGYLRQLIWREFSYHLLFHAPDFPEKPWNKRFEKFPWLENQEMLRAWQKGQTGYPIIDAGMRQLWQTGWMHNRVRMIAGSFLVKNLLQDWRLGQSWFWDTLVDADLGNNAVGWQWVAGCGADAAPYFRIFNPVLQSKKFDPSGEYIRYYVPELKGLADKYIHTPWEAPESLRPQNYPAPIVDLRLSRDRALEAYGISKQSL